ncbi:MvdC/MvdD family ATP grasp protein, partial [Streptomyces sp. NPDC055078]
MLTPDAAPAEHLRPVLVITTTADLTADRVVLELDRLDVPVLRFDLADFPGRVSLDATVRDGGGWTGTLSTRGRTVLLEQLAAILWWHPGRPRIDTDHL